MTNVPRSRPETRQELQDLPEDWIETLIGELYNGSLQVTDCHRRFQGVALVGHIEAQSPPSSFDTSELGAEEKANLSETSNASGATEELENVEEEAVTYDKESNPSKDEPRDEEESSFDTEKEDSVEKDLDSSEVNSCDVEQITLIDLLTESDEEWEARKANFFTPGKVNEKTEDVQKVPEEEVENESDVSMITVEDVKTQEDYQKEATEDVDLKLEDSLTEPLYDEKKPTDIEKDPKPVKDEEEDVNSEATEDILLEAEDIQKESDQTETEDVTKETTSDNSLISEQVLVESEGIENVTDVVETANNVTRASDEVVEESEDVNEIHDDSQTEMAEVNVLEQEDAHWIDIAGVEYHEQDASENEDEESEELSELTEKETTVETSAIFEYSEDRSEHLSEESFGDEIEEEVPNESSFFDDVKPEAPAKPEHILHLETIVRQEIQFFKSQMLVLQCQQASKNALLKIENCVYPDYETLRRTAFMPPKVGFNEGIPEKIKQQFMSLLFRISQLRVQFLIIQSQSSSQMARLFLVNQQNRVDLMVANTCDDLLGICECEQEYPTSVQELLDNLIENIQQNTSHSMILASQWASRSTMTKFKVPFVEITGMTIHRAERLLESLGFEDYIPEIIKHQVMSFLEQVDRYKARELVIQCQNASKFARPLVTHDHLGLYELPSVPELTNRRVSNQSDSTVTEDTHQSEHGEFPEEYISQSPNPDDSWLQCFNFASPLELSTLQVAESLLVDSLDISVSSILSEMPDVNLSEQLCGEAINNPSGRRHVLQIAQNLNTLVNSTTEYFSSNQYHGSNVLSLHLPSTSRNEQPETLIRVSNPYHRSRETTPVSSPPEDIEEEESPQQDDN